MSSTEASPEGLARWMAYLGQGDCPCPHEYKALGRLYGISFGKGWVRMDTDPRCPHHGAPERKTR
jgi:hypothetical protein